MRKAAKYSAAHRGTSFLAIQNGKTLLEQYPGKATADDPQRIYSGTKAFWNLAALAAAEDGILDLDDRVSGHDRCMAKGSAQITGHNSAVARFFLRARAGLRPPGE